MVGERPLRARLAQRPDLAPLRPAGRNMTCCRRVPPCLWLVGGGASRSIPARESCGCIADHFEIKRRKRSFDTSPLAIYVRLNLPADGPFLL